MAEAKVTDPCRTCGCAKTMHALQPRPVMCYGCKGKAARHIYIGDIEVAVRG